VNQENTNLKIIIKGQGAQHGQRVRLASMDLHHQVLPTEYARIAKQENTKHLDRTLVHFATFARRVLHLLQNQPVAPRVMRLGIKHKMLLPV
jgi:hypothetical protein